MIISDLEHQEVICPSRQKETFRGIIGGAPFEVSAFVELFVSGDTFSKALALFNVYVFKAPIIGG